jgi:hypothetical protein
MINLRPHYSGKFEAFRDSSGNQYARLQTSLRSYVWFKFDFFTESYQSFDNELFECENKRQLQNSLEEYYQSVVIRDQPECSINWLPIETAPKVGKPYKMFGLIAKDVVVSSGGVPYTTDPYYVWRDNHGCFARWPHEFPPTHWHPMPEFD